MEAFGDFQISKIPEEVWDSLFTNQFDMVRDRTSIINSMLASVTWNKALHNRKIIIFFYRILPHLINYIGSSALLKLRFVSKSWRDDIDRFLENHDSHQTYSGGEAVAGHPRRLNTPSIPRYSITLHRPDRVRQIANEIKGHPRNPFPGRSLTVQMMWRTRNAMVSILDEFGAEVWFLHLDIYETPLIFSEFVEECVRRTPNLKALYIDGEVIPPQMSGYLSDLEQAAELIQYLRFVLFSQLHNLETLQLRIFNDVTKLIAKSILLGVVRLPVYARQLTRLTLEINCLSDIQFVLPRCRVLRDLELVIRTSADELYVASIFDSPIQRLVFTVTEEFSGSLDFITKILNQLAETLEVFILRLPAGIVSEVDGNWRFENVTLPKLKTLELIDCFGVSRGITFSATQTLENFHVKYSKFGDAEVQRREMAEYFGPLILGQVGTQNSQMWQLFRKLKVFTHSFVGGSPKLEYCSREMYEYLEKLKNDF